MCVCVSAMCMFYLFPFPAKFHACLFMLRFYSSVVFGTPFVDDDGASYGTPEGPEMFNSNERLMLENGAIGG